MHYLFILQQSPYQSTLAREALDFALASAAFDQQVELLYVDDGVYQLLAQQESLNTFAQKNIEKTLQSLSLYEIETVNICQASAKSRGIEQLALNLSSSELTVNYLNHEAIAKLIQQADKVFRF